MARSYTKSELVGRPTKMTPEVLDKLRQAYLIGATNNEACGYADISVKTLYNYIEKVPEFLQQIEQWKNEPILKAKTTVVKNLDDTKNAQWYLERKRKAEFGNNIDITTGGDKLNIALVEFIGDDGTDDPKNAS